MIGLGIEINDLARPALRRVGSLLAPDRLKPLVGEAATRVYREHLRELDRTRPNKLGGKRTHFYAQARDDTDFTVDADGVTVSIRSVGIRQRYFGGVIAPTAAKYLTIPVHPNAHGRKAREFDLGVVYGTHGKPVALATKVLNPNRTMRGPDGRRIRQPATRPVGEVYYILTKGPVHQAPDPSILPMTDVVAGAVYSRINDRVARAIAKEGTSA